MGNRAAADEYAKPMEQGRMRFCPDTPHLYWPAYLEYALDHGDMKEAEKRANALYRKADRDKSDLSYTGAVLRCWAYTDPERALELFAKRLEWSIGMWDQKKGKADRDKSDLSYTGAVLRCWAYTDPERALELFAKRLEWSIGMWDQKKAYDFDKGGLCPVPAAVRSPANSEAETSPSVSLVAGERYISCKRAGRLVSEPSRVRWSTF